MQKVVYLDNNATTPLSSGVKETLVHMLDEYGNPSSLHSLGQRANSLLTKARRDSALVFNVEPNQLVFTSGATESLNHLLYNFATKGTLLVATTEHAAVKDFIEKTKCSVEWVTPNEEGVITQEAVVAHLHKNISAIVVMAVNNETGTINAWEEIAELAYDYNIPYLVDGTALLGKGHVSMKPGITAFVFSGHKCHALKGVGITLLQKGVRLSPLLFGGPQERQLRGGTENLLSITSFAKALQEIHKDHFLYMQKLHAYFEEELLQRFPEAVIHGGTRRIGNVTNISFANLDGESLLMQLDLFGIKASHGSACSSGALEPSRVLQAMHVPFTLAKNAVRFSLSRLTTAEELHYTLEKLDSALQQRCVK